MGFLADCASGSFGSRPFLFNSRSGVWNNHTSPVERWRNGWLGAKVSNRLRTSVKSTSWKGRFPLLSLGKHAKRNNHPPIFRKSRNRGPQGTGNRSSERTMPKTFRHLEEDRDTLAIFFNRGRTFTSKQRESPIYFPTVAPLSPHCE